MEVASLLKGCQILCVDLRFLRNTPCIDSVLETVYDVHQVASIEAIESAVLSYKPKLICYNFGLPDQVSLEALRTIKAKFPSIPFIMLTEDYSTELAIWALRVRAWDYFVKPVDANEVFTRIDALLKLLSGDSIIQRNNCMPPPEILSESRPYKTCPNGASTASAIDYIKQHLSAKINIEEVAKRCGMSKSHFSRTFKKEHSITFQEFVIKQRMSKAAKLLKNTDLHITQIALAVGYSELSNFTATFQRLLGTGPSNYRKVLISEELGQQRGLY